EKTVGALQQLQELADRVDIPKPRWENAVILVSSRRALRYFFRYQIIETIARQSARNVLREAATGGRDRIATADLEGGGGNRVHPRYGDRQRKRQAAARRVERLGRQHRVDRHTVALLRILRVCDAGAAEGAGICPNCWRPARPAVREQRILLTFDKNCGDLAR